MNRRGFLIVGMCSSGVALAAVQLDKILGKLNRGKQPGDDTLSKGLKEALNIGTEKAVNITGRLDGYFKNQAIKILMPDKLRPMETGLRLVGLQPKVDEFVLSMNRAAEQAAPLAKPIFRDAILRMTIADARRILTGGDTAATDYFKAQTGEPLAAAFRPGISQAMSQTGVTSQYQQLLGRFQRVPFARTESFDLENYVVRKALDGLFYVVGQEEKKIRTDPAARVTSLLKEVFGGIR